MKKRTAVLQLDFSQPGIWKLNGELSMYGVSDLWPVLKKNRPLHGSWEIDCQKLSIVDTAGIALLLDCMRYAKAHTLTLSIQSLPEGAKNLIAAQGVVTFFKFQ